MSNRFDLIGNRPPDLAHASPMLYTFDHRAQSLMSIVQWMLSDLDAEQTSDKLTTLILIATSIGIRCYYCTRIGQRLVRYRDWVEYAGNRVLVMRYQKAGALWCQNDVISHKSGHCDITLDITNFNAKEILLNSPRTQSTFSYHHHPFLRWIKLPWLLSCSKPS